MKRLKIIVSAAVAVSMLAMPLQGAAQSSGIMSQDFALVAKASSKTTQKKASNLSNVKSTTTQKAASSLVFEDSFASKTLSKWSWFENSFNFKADRRAISVVSDPQNASNNVLMLKNSDTDRQFDGGNPRSEIVYDRRGNLSKVESYSWRFMVDPGHSNSSKWEVIGQWHCMPDSAKGENWSNWKYKDACPPVALFIKNDKVYVVLNNAAYGKVVESREYKIEKGKWVDFKFNIRWSTGNDGYIEGWIDGQPIVFDYYGSFERMSYPTMLNDVGNIFKIGTYRERTTGGVSKVYYDDVRIEALEK